jgi:hypothetical protein
MKNYARGVDNPFQRVGERTAQLALNGIGNAFDGELHAARIERARVDFLANALKDRPNRVAGCGAAVSFYEGGNFR